MNARNKRVTYVTVLLVIAVVSALRLVLDLRSGDTEAATVWIALLVVLAIVAVTLLVVVRRVTACARHAARHRPGSVVVPGFTTAEMPDIARHQGATARGWMTMGGSPVAVVVTPTELEVWGRRDDAPRWVVQRTPDGVTDGPAVYGGREVPAVWAHDGLAAVVFVPAYRPLRATAGTVGTDISRAVAELSGTASAAEAR
ncbi:hypothetical protein MWU57_13430 [Isoptericola sp. S6320L]|uniref:hypothetical protein n=1 Tax=Isoptericola sp. S6320L TaxID=2926411 RepID=UPI001FF2B360|nr:hypothetical protein [Isoptericola sp. S6320L]MCK0118035.1 hypothetical protein [Isoptericola sp. S6320L]